MPYDIADLKKIKIKIKRSVSAMANPDNVDYSFSTDEKLIIHNPNSEEKPNEEITPPKPGPSSETNITKDCIDSGQDVLPSMNVDEEITKYENILTDLKKQKEEKADAEDKRIIRDVSNKRSRKKKYTSSPRYDSSTDSSLYQDKSPSPKRTKKEFPRKNYDTDSSPQRDSSQDSLGSDRSYSCVSKKLKKELSSFLGNSFVSLNAKKRYSRKNPRRAESKDRFKEKDTYDRSRYSRRERSRSRSRRDDSYDRYSKRKSTKSNRGASDRNRYNNYDRNYQKSKDIEERYSRYYAVMYAFSIIMDILRQDDIYSNF